MNAHKDAGRLLTGFDEQGLHLHVYSVERGGPRIMHLSSTKHRATDFRTLDSNLNKTA